jgi:RNA polymerase sigma-70 factor (ECF subfamily)
MEDRAQTEFSREVLPHSNGLRLHCYRMLGSSSDSEDMVQETLLRAFRSRETLKDPALLRPWLYRIATHTCLDELARRPRRLFVADAVARSAEPDRPRAPAAEEALWLEPMPDAWLPADGDPEARYALKESVALAFVAALQTLPSMQRATLLLRDVVGLSAEETASATETTVSAANSALARARKSIDERLLGGKVRRAAEAGAQEADKGLLARYVTAFEGGDVEGFIALLHDDIRTTMPPSPTWFSGIPDNRAFFSAMFRTPGLGHLVMVPLAANGQPGFAYYRSSHKGGTYRLHAIQVVTIADGKLFAIDHFMGKTIVPVFGLPEERTFA